VEPRFPFLVKNGKYELVHPLTFDELVLHEMRLFAHADPLHEAGRGKVAGVARADNTVPPEVVESQRKHGLGRLGGQTPPVVVRVKDKSCLALTVLPAEPLKANLTNYPAGLTPYHRVRQPFALGVEYGFSALLLQGAPCLGAIAGLPAQITGHIRAGLIVVQIIKIISIKRSEDQPRCLNGGRAGCHSAMLMADHATDRACWMGGHRTGDGECRC
jgi:hypothetical protein